MGKLSTSIWRTELREICKILKNNGIDIQKIPVRKTISDGKRVPTILKDINIEGIDVIKIIKENELNEDFPIGYYLSKYRNAYNGTKGILTKEEREEGEVLGIVVKRNQNASVPIFKGRKISQFHLDYITGILDKILNGQINTKEALDLLNQASIDNGETIIKDAGTIKRCVEMLLKDRPEELKSYHEIAKTNSGRRSPYKGKIGKPQIGLYYERELKFKQHIIEHYLPLIMSGEIMFDTIEKQLSTSHHTVNKIIEEFYTKNNDLEGLEQYRKSKKKNAGVSLEARENAKTLREEVAGYDIVSNAEFLLLSPEEQDKQILMKYRKEKLKEEMSSNGETRVTSEAAVCNAVQKIKDYFKGKNNPENHIENFSEQDTRYIIFRYPSILGRTPETLDTKLEVLTSYEGIDENTAFGMIKTFPGVIGYAPDRIKSQLDLLQKENLIDYIIIKPDLMRQSVQLMYALIEYAKQRHRTTDLSDITRSNIFMANKTLQRLYGVTYDEIKTRYPYGEAKNNEDDSALYIVTGQDIINATYTVDITNADEASDIVNQASQPQNNKGGE